ncbi:hypothetical protein [Escherichia marmotae]|uniref:hypothetical protein n=1 Tax=Escherichia TaxID=561 RepID=UPI001F4E3EE9|nr:hypothetical protein [Escherichia marmotae]MED0362679.1 hypothetical protein [Escherichia marmotae]MED8774704.1 hypothetical protein [Escherichia marmotae]UNH35356.1 hypothetical protein MNY74_02215 [Escherichia marmotae]
MAHATHSEDKKLTSVVSGSIEQKLASAGSASREQKLTSIASVTKEQKLCCVSSMEGGGTEYPGTSDGKPPKPGVSRKHSDRMQCSPCPARPCLFQGKTRIA